MASQATDNITPKDGMINQPTVIVESSFQSAWVAAARLLAKNLFKAYNRPGGFFDHVQSMVPHKWGTYFRRMTNYETSDGIANQLELTIAAIRSDSRVFKGAFCIVIQVPGGETKLRRGGPCLNYVAVQRTQGENAELGLLAVYRSHDFLERAYGNYWGLCNLLNFMAKETKSQPGPLTCVSSVAYVPGQKQKLERFESDLRCRSTRAVGRRPDGHSAPR